MVFNAPKLYSQLASWWPLLSRPEDYHEEAQLFFQAFQKYRPNIKTILELGSGGGNNASHLKKYYQMTLVDCSPQMLSVSQKLNPDCEHIQGDMRTVRLQRTFDAVFIHDAIMYLTHQDDLEKALQTAFLHCKPGGMALFIPDCFQENFSPSTHHGGHDGTGKALRYLEWIYDPDPSDSHYTADFAYLLREGNSVQVESDRHLFGLFSKQVWQNLLESIGFTVFWELLEHSELPKGLYEGVVGIKPP